MLFYKFQFGPEKWASLVLDDLSTFRYPEFFFHDRPGRTGNKRPCRARRRQCGTRSVRPFAKRALFAGMAQYRFRKANALRALSFAMAQYPAGRAPDGAHTAVNRFNCPIFPHTVVPLSKSSFPPDAQRPFPHEAVLPNFSDPPRSRASCPKMVRPFIFA